MTLQYGDPAVNRKGKAQTAYQEVEAALAAAGLKAGSHHRGSGWSDEGILEYRAPLRGYVIHSFVPDFRKPYLRRIYVTHAGTGRKEAIPQYWRALEAAGLHADIAPRPHHHNSDVLVRRLVRARIFEPIWEDE